MKSPPRRSRARGLAAATFLAAALAASPARAEYDAFAGALTAVAEALNELNFHAQLQAGLFAVSANDFRPGGLGARAGFNLAGFGASAGLRLERYPTGMAALALLDFEFRPLPFLKHNRFRTIDPFLLAGLEIGGGTLDFRATQTFGAGLDLGLFARPESNHETLHPVLSLRYVYRLWQIPEPLPQHLVMIGAATRLAF